MTFLVSWAVYGIFYFFYYLWGFILLSAVADNFHIPVPLSVARFILLSAAAAAIVLSIVAGLRAKIAASTYSTNRYTLLEAHNISGALLKSQLRFLPIIGGLFQKGDEESPRRRYE